MYKVKAERTIDKPIELVFTMLTDHGNYSQFPGVKDSKLLEEGHTDINGEGALRYIDAGKMRLTERITSYTFPTRMTYHIESSEPVFIDLRKGEVTLYQEGQSTRVVWISEGNIKVPIIGPILDKIMQKQFTRAFGSILKSIANA